ncbi:unnamed protein product [Toxocara canis]|uniref:Transposase n=1 Tax=Toxocara canis TaxID=6265 RepID=A0A183URV7_TOXCA|nr:unnamed protein product [Toxocara canis]
MGDYFTAATEQIKSSGNEFMDEFTVGRNLVKGSWELQRVSFFTSLISTRVEQLTADVRFHWDAPYWEAIS